MLPTKIWENIANQDNTDMILYWDWNSVRSYSRDTYIYSIQINPKAKLEIDRGF